MNVYIILRLLYCYVNDDDTVIKLMSDTAIFFIPVVNYDGYKAIGDAFRSTGQLRMIRKNRHQYVEQKNCQRDDIGVDLNRNYPFMFAHDNEGSSGSDHMCQDDYRGPSAASEPETKSMIKFAETWTNLKVVISLHAYGNLFIIPFNFDNGKDNLLFSNY